MTRRAALAAGIGVVGVAALSACTSGSDGPGPSTPAPPSTDEVARRAAAGREQVLSDQATVLASTKGTPRRVATAAGLAVAAHTAHVAALLDGLPQPSPATSGTASAGGTTSASPPGGAVTVTSLVRAEIAAAAAHQAALGPLSGPLARLLASVAASDASLASALRGAAS